MRLREAVIVIGIGLLGGSVHAAQPATPAPASNADKPAVPAAAQPAQPAAPAAASAPPAPTAAQAAKPAKPAPVDLARGQKLAAEVCAACHGPDGNSPLPENPRLAGQVADYIA
jgi:cytochrome c553